MKLSAKPLLPLMFLSVFGGFAIAQQAVPPPMGVPANAPGVPKFQPDPFWPKPLPGNWILGQVAGIAVSPDNHI